MPDWRVIYVKSRSEKKVAQRLESYGFPVYCPTQTVMRQWSDRKKKVTVPIFSSYVFVKFSEAENLTVLQTPGVARVVYWLGKPAVIREEEIKVMQDFLSEYSNTELTCHEVQEGDRVKVSHGSFREQQGVVVRTTARRVILQIDCLGVALHADLSRGAIEKL